LGFVKEVSSALLHTGDLGRRAGDPTDDRVIGQTGAPDGDGAAGTGVAKRVNADDAGNHDQRASNTFFAAATLDPLDDRRGAGDRRTPMLGRVHRA